jgi:hypothetical protein
MSDLGPLLALGIVVGAVCVTVGAKQLGTRLIMGSIGLAVVLPLVLCTVGSTSVSLAPIFSTLGWALLVLVVVAVIAGALAFVRQRRALEHWREPDEPPQSQKRRIDPG